MLLTAPWNNEVSRGIFAGIFWNYFYFYKFSFRIQASGSSSAGVSIMQYKIHCNPPVFRRKYSETTIIYRPSINGDSYRGMWEQNYKVSVENRDFCFWIFEGHFDENCAKHWKHRPIYLQEKQNVFLTNHFQICIKWRGCLSIILFNNDGCFEPVAIF